MPIILTADWTRQVLSQLKGTPFEFTLWDGQKTKVGTGRSQFKFEIKKSSVVRNILKSPSLGFAEGYINGQIDVQGSLEKLISVGIENERALAHIAHDRLWGRLAKRLVRSTSIRQQRADISHHYDLGNDFYQLWLDKRMVYSCAYFKTERDTIDQAQLQKIDRTLQKLGIEPGQKLLDVGSGWGGLVIRAAKHYRAQATGITLSSQQYSFANRKRAIEKAKQASFRLLDYRQLPKTWHGRYDCWVSVGMFEHVGQANIEPFVQSIKAVLKPGGIGLLHSIVTVQPRPGNPFLLKYIFPGGYIATISEILKALEQQGLFIIDLENLKFHYALTLDLWSRAFEQNVDKIRQMYDESFVRMWRFYLQGGTAGFRSGEAMVVQILFSNGRPRRLPLVRI